MRPLGIVCPNHRDGTSLYRGMGVMHDILDQVDSLRISHFTGELSWPEAKTTSGLFLQRPFTAPHLEICKLIRNNNRPLWLDYDDDLFSVPLDNPTYKMYGKEQIQRYMKGCMGMANVITVSTEKLKQRIIVELVAMFGDVYPEIIVVPNAYDSGDMLSDQRTNERKKTVLWRGSETHVKDVMIHAPEIVRLSEENPEWEWVFMGMPPWMLNGHVKKLRHVESQDPIQFFEKMKLEKADIMIVPLDNNEFNKSKSNIAWIEATHAGMITLAPRWPEWTKPGITNYNDPSEFGSALNMLMNSPMEIKTALWQLSRQYIDKELTLNKVNRKRIDILNKYFYNGKLFSGTMA